MKYIFIILIGLILMSGCISDEAPYPEVNKQDLNDYALLGGYTGGQILNGGINNNENLTLNASANGIGTVIIKPVLNVKQLEQGYGLKIVNASFDTRFLGIGYDADSNWYLSAMDKPLWFLGGSSIKTETIEPNGTLLIYGNTTFFKNISTFGNISILKNMVIGTYKTPYQPFQISDSNAMRLSRAGYDATNYGDIVYDTTGLKLTGSEGYFTIAKGSSVTSTQYLRIINGGNTSIGGSTTPNTALFNVGGIGTSVRFSSYGAGTATFDSGGNISSISDEKYKTNIQPYTNGLSKILQLNPVTYNWKPESGLATQDLNIGLIANEVKNVMPEIVSSKKDVYYEQVLTKPEIKNKDTDEIIQEAEYTTIEKPVLDNYGKQSETLSYSQQGVIDALINAVKEQQKQIDRLNAICGGIKP